METPSTSNGTPETAPDSKFVSGPAQECCELEKAEEHAIALSLFSECCLSKLQGARLCGCEVGVRVAVLGGCLWRVRKRDAKNPQNSVATSQTGNIFKCVLWKSKKILTPENG